MKKYLGIFFLSLMWCNISYANVSYTCYLTELPNSNPSYDIQFGKLVLTIDNNGTVYTEYETEFHNMVPKKGVEITKAYEEWAGIYIDYYLKATSLDEAQKLLENSNPFLDKKKKFNPNNGKFWDIRYSAGDMIQTNKELMIDAPDNGNSANFWEINLNKLEAIYNVAWTPEFILNENKFLKSLPKEVRKGNTTLFNAKPFYSLKFKNCTSNEASNNEQGGSGTAFFINNRGNLITNNHVVEGCKTLKINYFNKELEVDLISTDKTLDLALLKVKLKPRSFISFSKKEPKKRQVVIVAGYPLGQYLSDDLKINEGKISSLKGFENNSNEITVDLAINPGNSGGPIVNENGQLVAVAVAGMSKEVTEGISFGIKSSAVTNFLKTNKINSEINRSSFSMNDEKVNQLLEESTVYISCEL